MIRAGRVRRLGVTNAGGKTYRPKVTKGRLPMRQSTTAFLAMWWAIASAAGAAPATDPAPTTAPATRPAGPVPVTPAVAATLYEERKLSAPPAGANERYRL